ncbi:MAG: DUF4245 family protein [Nocardioidaceae bacterium]|nr:DUF4245 family protein [Nocardioidaceae bacterium]MCL2612031.1 DUF4245 family protein [Nocardioidaceae bacterium]
MSTTQQAGGAGRYQRSPFGLIVALVVTVAVVVGVMGFMGLFQRKTDIKPAHVNYMAAVLAAQEGHIQPAYPTRLPVGYFATQAQVPDDYDGFVVDLLRGQKDFIGIRTARKATVSELVDDNVDKSATSAPAYVPTGVDHPLAPRWAGYRDDRGDTGYAATIGKDKVLVFGSAPVGDLQQVVDALTFKQLPQPHRATPTKAAKAARTPGHGSKSGR